MNSDWMRRLTAVRGWVMVGVLIVLGAVWLLRR
jgi:hypothetical protein